MRTVTLVPGDGIGPEITESLKEVFSAAKVQVAFDEVAMGLPAFEMSGQLIPNEFIKSMETTKVALKGPTTTPVGTGHRSINVTLRQKYKLFANVRPITSLVADKSIHQDIDMLVVRENSEDLYKGIEYMVGEDVAHGIKLITADASKRIASHAFKLAQNLGRRKVTAIHKANIMKFTDGLFLESCRKVASSYPDITFEEMIVDNACMQMVMRPRQFDVIVTENLYGDILSDLGAGLIGGLGLVAGANFGTDKAIFEAAHGSAPDIAGQNKANPTALILSGLMMLDYIDLGKVAERLRKALLLTLKEDRTADLGGNLTTQEFTSKVIGNL